jgi:exodeoxyribonuclease-3
MKIYSWNVNSLRNAEESVLALLAQHQPDILFIQELRAHPDQLSFFLKFVDGYEAVFNDSGKPGYAGTAAYYKMELQPDKITTETKFDVLNNEGRTIVIQKGNNVFVNWYIPNGNASQERLDYKMNFHDAITLFCKQAVEKGFNVIAGGDFNVCHTEDDVYAPDQFKNQSCFLPMERKWMTDFIRKGFVDTFREFNKDPENYSWWNLRDPKRFENKGLRLDYLFVNESFKDNVKNSAIHKDIFGSDHCPISVEIDL